MDWAIGTVVSFLELQPVRDRHEINKQRKANVSFFTTASFSADLS